MFNQTPSYNTSGVFNFTVPAGVTSIYVETWGGGGGGAGGNANRNGGGGGGGGGFSSNPAVSVIPGNTYSLTVAAGGIGVSSGNGGNGGSSVFNGPLV